MLAQIVTFPLKTNVPIFAHSTYCLSICFTSLKFWLSALVHQEIRNSIKFTLHLCCINSFQALRLGKSIPKKIPKFKRKFPKILKFFENQIPKSQCLIHSTLLIVLVHALNIPILEVINSKSKTKFIKRFKMSFQQQILFCSLDSALRTMRRNIFRQYENRNTKSCLICNIFPVSYILITW